MSEESIEVQARAMGWVPKDEFKGDESKWKEAEDFVKDGYEILPILRERTKKLSTKFDEVTQELASTRSTLQQLTEHHKKTEERAYERAKANLEAERRKAVENNDITTYDKIGEQIDNLEKPESDEKPENAPEFIAWQTENPWYGQRVDMAMYADSVAEYVKNQNPNLKGKAFYDKVTEEVKVRFPKEFENPNRQEHNVVEGAGGGGNDTGGGKKKKTYNDMPQDAKDFCDEMVRQGMTREQYVKEYWELEED